MPNPPLKRRRSLVSDCTPGAKRQAVALWLDNVEVHSPFRQAPAVPHAESPSSSSDPCRLVKGAHMASDQSQSTQSQSRRTGSEAHSWITISRGSTDFGPKLESCNVMNADARRDKPKPDNWPELRAILCQARETPEASVQDHGDVGYHLHRFVTEQSVFVKIRDYLLKKEWAHDPKAANSANISWMRHVPIEANTRNTTFRFPDPKPDITYGWVSFAFRYRYLESLLEAPELPEPRKGMRRSYCAPNPHVWWPFATVEAKGSKGTFAECHLQNQQSAAIMLKNRFYLKRVAHLPLPYGRAFIFTIDLTTAVRLNCHWVSQDDDGNDVYWTKQLAGWDLLSIEPDELNKARRGIRNCIDYARQINFEELQVDLSSLHALYPTELSAENAISANATSTQ